MDNMMPPLLVLIGAGTDDVRSALEQYPDTRVLLLEPDPARATRFPSSDRVLLLADPDYAGWEEAWRLFPTSGEMPPVIVHPELQPGPGTARAREVLKKILFGVRANAEARRRFAPRYLINSLRNIPSILAGRDVRALTDAFKGTPAILVAAGPSLDNAIDDLREARDRAVIIATDTALRPLLVNGIAPHLVVALDPSSTNARHLQALPECGDTWMISESAMDPAAIEAFGDRTFWFRAANHQPWPWLNELGLDIGRLDVWGSVLTGAFQVACLAGCDPIVTVGADLSYTGNRPYARGTTYEFDWAWSAAEGAGLDAVWLAQIAKAGPGRVTDTGGEETLATPALLSFRDWMVAQARRSGRRVINATGAGLFFGDGVEQMSLSEALPSRAAGKTPVDAIASRSAKGLPERRVALASALRHVRRNIPSAWAEFSGDGFDPDAVGSALDEAALALESGRRPPARKVIDWAPLVASKDSGSLFIQLPEAMARFRAGLQGAESLGALERSSELTASERAATLVQALLLLERICEHGGELPLRATPAFDTPVHASYEWPEAVRWAVAAFEAMLGKVIPRSLALPDGRFFAGPRLDAAQPYVLLALEWLRSAASLDDTPQSAFAQAVSCLTGVGTAVQTAAERDAARGNPALKLSAAAGGASATITLPLGVREAALARVLTGTRADEPATTIDLANVQTPALSVTMSLERSEPARRDRATIALSPRVLSGDVLAPSFVAYTTPRGAVCVAPHTRESVLVRPDGSVEPHHTWPHGIVLELPWGEDGAVAWSNGLARWPNTETPYVMYRRRAADQPSYEELPFRPGIGTWWRDRVFWACMPSGINAWTGVASWAGQDARIELAGPVLYDLQPDGEDALILQRRALGESGRYERRIVSEGLKWTPGQAPEAVDLGEHGASSCRASNGKWTACARPEADLIEFESPERTVSLVCHWPHRLAWIGRSLIVNTLEERDVLFFEDVISWLER